MSTDQNDKNRPPYLFGLLCLLPLIGALVAVGIIFYGIFRYKDKLFTAIGFFGIIFTICIYFFVLQNIRFGMGATKSFAKISQKELNNLVKYIEFYKLQNNNYPDSLEQLQPDGTFLIQDPLLVRKLDKANSSDFQYKRFGDKYSLFSEGIDGIANTKDDIYPNILNSDSSKFGLIRK